MLTKLQYYSSATEVLQQNRRIYRIHMKLIVN